MDLVAAVDRIAAVEEDRVRHGRIVVFLREPRSFHSLRPIGAAGGAVAGAAGGNDPAVPRRAVDRHRHLLRTLIDGDEDAGMRGGDRKSTRLNSSHMSISYAVFCLKKKKKKK